MAPLLDDDDEGSVTEANAAEAELASASTRKRSGEDFFDDAETSHAEEAEEDL